MENIFEIGYLNNKSEADNAKYLSFRVFPTSSWIIAYRS